MFLHRDTAAPEAKIVYYPSQVAFTKAPSKAQLFLKLLFKLPIFTGIQYQVPSCYICCYWHRHFQMAQNSS